jgi:hypothetical protein
MAAPDLPDVDWGRVFAEAVAIALKFTRRDVEDLVEDAMTMLFAGETRWDPAGKETLAEHLAAVGLKARFNKLRTERRRRNPRVVGKMVQMFEDDRLPTPEEAALESEERQHKMRLFEQLFADFADDDDARAILSLEQQGVHGQLEQATEGRMDIAVVRNAHKRIARRVEALAGRDEEDEAAS